MDVHKRPAMELRIPWASVPTTRIFRFVGQDARWHLQVRTAGQWLQVAVFSEPTAQAAKQWLASIASDDNR